MRREIRAWSAPDLEQLREALTIMSNTTLGAGRALYGPRFITHARLSMMHAVAVLDPRGDQGHSNWAPDRPQQCFFTFHNALLMAIENVIEDITRVHFHKPLDALPYWDASLDSPGGPYHGDAARSIYAIIGSRDGDAEQRYGVVDGLMAFARVPAYPTPASDPVEYAEIGAAARRIFPRPAAGWTRKHTVKNATWLVQRFPALNMKHALIPHDESNPARDLSTVMEHYPRGFAGVNDTSVHLTPQMILTCRGTVELATARHAASQLSIDHFLACQDAGTFNMTSPSVPCPIGQQAQPLAARQWRPSRCQQLWTHSQGHFKVGGQSELGLPTTAAGWLDTWPADGDFADLATSPNDLLPFILWHADEMRHFLRWQQRALQVEPALKEALWGFRTGAADGVNPGCGLHDVISSNLPFANGLFFENASAPTGYTHADVLRMTSPGLGLQYDYDESQADPKQWRAACRRVNREHLGVDACDER